MNQPTQPALPSPVPYLIRALYEWLGECNDLPQVMIDQTVPGVEVPPHLRGKPTVLYSIDMTACPDINLGTDAITGSMRFGERSFKVRFPIDSIIYIQGRHTQPIMLFRPMPLDANRAPAAVVDEPVAPVAEETPAAPPEATEGKKRERASFLSVVK